MNARLDKKIQKTFDKIDSEFDKLLDLLGKENSWEGTQIKSKLEDFTDIFTRLQDKYMMTQFPRSK